MTRWQQTLEVARWEFRRFVKWKQQIIGVAVILALGLGGGFVGRVAKRVKQQPIPVAAVGADALGFPLPTVSRIAWDTSRSWDEASARAALAADELRGVLLVRGPTDVVLVLPSRAAWAESLEGALATARQGMAISRIVATSPETAALLAPLALRTEFLAEDAAEAGEGTKVAAFVILFLGFSLVMGGFGTIFTGITGEKQHRVTEQLIAIVPPQAWMDGKILGLAGAALVGTAMTAAGGFAVLKLLPALLGRSAIALPPIASDYGTLALILLVTLLGVGMWFSFMAAIAATIDDPNSSTRSLLLFLPMLPMGVALGMASSMDSAAAQALSVFPLTAPAMLPMRLVMTTLPWWEVPLALLLLVGAVWAFRRAAGKIFGTAVLMYGKEPSFRELWRWMRQA